MLKIGIVGSVIAAVCCFTPILVWVLAAVGLSTWLGNLDVILLPALTLFLIMTGVGLWRRTKKLS